MNILFDTNVLLDLLLDREPFSADAAVLFSMVERSEISGHLCATTITTIDCLLRKSLGRDEAERCIRTLLSLFTVAPVGRVVLEKALVSGFSDFEDAVLHAAACHAGADFIVTRNPRDFKDSKLSVLTPREVLGAIASLNG